VRSLIRTAKTLPETKVSDHPALVVVEQQEVAQCCAKVSKTVAGCHD